MSINGVCLSIEGCREEGAREELVCANPFRKNEAKRLSKVSASEAELHACRAQWACQCHSIGSGKCIQPLTTLPRHKLPLLACLVN